MTPGEIPPVRIGTVDRQAAMAALDEHLSQGRLTVDEYGERSALAANAVFAADLAALFTDLPQPHPRMPGLPVAVDPLTGAPVTGRPIAVEPAHRPERFLLPAAVALAVALFLLTRQWWWFMLIPAAAIYAGRRC